MAQSGVAIACFQNCPEHTLVFTLVEDTPTKALGEALEKLIDEESDFAAPDEQAKILKAASVVAKVPPTPVTPIDPSSPSTSPGLIQNIVTGMTSKFWNSMKDVDDQNEDSSEDNLEEVREQFERKAVGSPDNNTSIDFEKLTKQEKKKLRKSLNKSR